MTDKSTSWHLKLSSLSEKLSCISQAAWLYVQRLAGAPPFGSQRGTVDQCQLTSCYVFSAGMQGWAVVLLPLSHFSQRSNTDPPTERSLFCGGIPCLGWGWLPRTGPERASCLNGEQFRNRVRGMWFKPNCPVLSLCNEVIQMLRVLSKS